VPPFAGALRSENLAGQNPAHRGEQLFSGKGFRDEPGSTEIHYAGDGRSIVECRDGGDRNRRVAPAQYVEAGEPIDPGQGEVEQDQVDFVLVFEERERRLEIRPVGHDNPLLHLREQVHQPLADQRVVFNHQKLVHASPCSHRVEFVTCPSEVV